MDKDVFVRVDYVVAWAGCKVPLRERTFSGYDEALELYNSVEGMPSRRIEEVAVKTQIKIILRDLVIKPPKTPKSML